jgi:hypothetical protein
MLLKSVATFIVVKPTITWAVVVDRRVAPLKWRSPKFGDGVTIGVTS